jgi:hypothetical protein
MRVGGDVIQTVVEYAAVGIALVAILGDARDVDTIGTESDEMGSICSYEIMIEGIASITLGMSLESPI